MIVRGRKSLVQPRLEQVMPLGVTFLKDGDLVERP